MLFINESRSRVISNQMFFNVIFLKKGRTAYEINNAKYNYLVAPFQMLCLMKQRRILNNLQGSISAKLVNGYNQLTMFAK